MLDGESTELLALIASGCEKSMKRFFDTHHRSVYAFAMRRLDNSADAADVMNDVMLQVWKGANGFSGKSSVRTWLLGITNHKILDVFRRRGRAEFVELDENLEGDIEDSAESCLAQAEDVHRVKACMDKLSAAHREAVHMAFFDDMSYTEIAAVTGCPAGTVKTRVMHAKKNLMRCLRAVVNDSF